MDPAKTFLSSLKKIASPAICRFVSLAERHTHQLQPENLVAVYRAGRFLEAGDYGRLVWRDPERRAMIPIDERFRVGKRLTRHIRSGVFEVTFDRAFRAVVEGCAETGPRRRGTWISTEMVDSYTRLHGCGYAHSVEVWREGRLVGGEYGIAIGGFYSGESMFTREDYAGRVAMVYLVERLRKHGFSLFDTQQLNNLSLEFGAYEIGRQEFQALLRDALARDVRY